MDKMYILYDQNILWKGEHDATVLCTAETLAEAIADSKEMFDDSAIIWEYDTDGDNLINGRQVHG